MEFGYSNVGEAQKFSCAMRPGSGQIRRQNVIWNCWVLGLSRRLAAHPSEWEESVMVHNYPWSIAYATAVLEHDPAKLPDRIREAEQAIECRFCDPDIDAAELHALETAIDELKLLKSHEADADGVGE